MRVISSGRDFRGIESKYYAGIGSRKTPSSILRLMTEFASWLAKRDWILRSGGAQGADLAFQHGVEISNGEARIYYAADGNRIDALSMASKFHPAWDHCSDFAKKLHARNCFQVLGDNLSTPAKFVCCWTPDGSTGITSFSTGGTGQAIRIAHANNIRIFNLARQEDLDIVTRRIKE